VPDVSSVPPLIGCVRLLLSVPEKADQGFALPGQAMIKKQDFLALSIVGRFEWVIAYMRQCAAADKRPSGDQPCCLAGRWFDVIRVPMLEM
jgi:hypothetical protein